MKNQTPNTIGGRIRDLRRRNRETQDQLAHILNVTKPTISRKESNKNRFTKEEIANIAQHYNSSTDYIIKGETLNMSETCGEQRLLLCYRMLDHKGQTLLLKFALELELSLSSPQG